MQKLDNKKVDEIGRALVKASALPAREIEKIVDDKMLFEAVRMRIAVESPDRNSAPSRIRHRMAVLTACAVMIAGLAFFFFRSGPVEPVVADRTIPMPEVAPVKPVNRFAEPDRIADTAKLPAPVAMPRPERVTRPAPMKINRPEQRAAEKSTRENEFYALSYAGDPSETERGGRIVRVDLPRTVLFAMGVDIPLENEVETVKADLLIGNDGVTRAIRVVK